MGYRRRGCRRGDWNCALALPERAAGQDDAVVATDAGCLAGSGRIGTSPGFEFPAKVNERWP